MDEEEKKQLKQRKRNRGGRGITPYRPEFDKQAYNYCLIGATDVELGLFFGVAEKTIKKWKKRYPDFRESIRAAKQLADMKVAGCLYKRAIGYTYQEVVSETVKVPTANMQSEKGVDTGGPFLTDHSNGFQKIKITTREVVPDTRAQIFWLKNRQPELWRDKREIDHTAEGKKSNVITIFELPNDHRND
jgi:hypothetical protein